MPTQLWGLVRVDTGEFCSRHDDQYQGLHIYKNAMQAEQARKAMRVPEALRIQQLVVSNA